MVMNGSQVLTVSNHKNHPGHAAYRAKYYKKNGTVLEAVASSLTADEAYQKVCDHFHAAERANPNAIIMWDVDLTCLKIAIEELFEEKEMEA